MKKLINILKNKEIMGRIVFTIMILFIFRLGAQITVPGVSIPESSNLANALNDNSALSLMNLLGGGTLQSFSIFALGVSPYITAQIIVQLLSTDVLPALTELKRQGQYGRKKIEMATRYLTLMLGAVQAYGIVKTMESQTLIEFHVAENAPWLTYIYVILILLAGTMLVMWLGDQISTKGIGNGISMIIFAGIVSSLPSQMVNAWVNWCDPSKQHLSVKARQSRAGSNSYYMYLPTCSSLPSLHSSNYQREKFQFNILERAAAKLKVWLVPHSYQLKLTPLVLFLSSSRVPS